MVIKQAILAKEKANIKSFLERFDLTLDQDVTTSLYLEEDGEMIGTISRSDYIIKCLAIDPLYQGDNLANQLITAIILDLAQENKFYYQVFTKKIYQPLFESLHFRTLTSTDKVVILEGGNTGIDDAIQAIKRQVELKIEMPLEKADIGAIVVNCNPITLGHYQLIEYASLKHDYLIVFVLEEDLSFFSYQERFSLVYLALSPLTNVIVIPSTRYIVSSLTFPSYFLKTIDEKEEEHAKLDALIFKQYFMPKLNIKKRYLGSETDLVMVKYNELLQRTLGDKVEIIPRFALNDQTISASLVRKLILENRIDEALNYVPKAIRPLLKGIAKERNEKQYK